MRTYKTPSDFDKLRQFLEMDRKVLRFFVVWDDRDSMFGEMRKFVLHVSYCVMMKLKRIDCNESFDLKILNNICIFSITWSMTRLKLENATPQTTVEIRSQF